MADLPHADLWSPGRTFLIAPVVAYIERGWHVVCRGCVETIGDSVRVQLERRESPESYGLDPREQCEVCHELLTDVRDRAFAELDRAR